MKPLVSLVVPTYNHEKYVDSFIKSVLNISYDNMELIVSDDFSEDKTTEIFENNLDILKKKFSSVRFNKNKKNLGIPANINSVLNLINGKYVKFIATDDILLSNSIEKLVDFYEKNGDAVLIYSNAYIVNDAFNIDKDDLNKYKMIYRNNQNTVYMFYERLFLKNIISAPTVMLKKTTIDEFGKFDENCFCEDTPYWLKISYNRIVKFLNEPTVCYRRTKKPKGYRLSLGYCKKMYEENKFLLDTYISRIIDKTYRNKIIFSRINQLFYYKEFIKNKEYDEDFRLMCYKYNVWPLNIFLYNTFDNMVNACKKAVKKVMRLEYEG